MMKRLLALPLIAALLFAAGCNGSSSAPAAAPVPQAPAAKPVVKANFGDRVVTQNYAITLYAPVDANEVYGLEPDMDWYTLNAVIEPTAPVDDILMSGRDGNGDSLEVLGLVDSPLTAGQTRTAEVTIKANGFKIDTYFVLSTFDDGQVYEWTFNK